MKFIKSLFDDTPKPYSIQFFFNGAYIPKEYLPFPYIIEQILHFFAPQKIPFDIMPFIAYGVNLSSINLDKKAYNAFFELTNPVLVMAEVAGLGPAYNSFSAYKVLNLHEFHMRGEKFVISIFGPWHNIPDYSWEMHKGLSRNARGYIGHNTCKRYADIDKYSHAMKELGLDAGCIINNGRLQILQWTWIDNQVLRDLGFI